MRKTIYVLCLTFVTLFILFGCGSKNEDLTTVNSKENLLSILKKYNGSGGYNATAESDKAVDNAAADSSTSTRDYSKTNTQVNGVDESDVVKTDGENIYLISQNQVSITQAYPVSDMKVIATLNYTDTGFYPSMLYVDENHLVVIGYYYEIINQPEPKAESYYYYNYSRSMTKVIVYDKGNYNVPSNELLLDGYVLSTRKIDNELLLITNQYINYWSYEQDKDFDPRPKYEINETENVIDYDEIHYKEGTNPQGFVTIMKFNLDSAAEIHYTYMGSGDNVYISFDNIYITQREYNFRIFNFIEKVSGTDAPEIQDKTLVTKIDVDTLSKTQTIDVRGHINNQFSLDEYDGNFRIVTTYGNTWDNTAENNLYIFDNDLNLEGKIEGFAKGEQIQSARFVGDRIYLVTFKTIDPFFVIDAKDPKNPKILGELKIPGYSTYLHPYDEFNMIGFGFDTTTVNQNGGEFTRITGLKLSLFDVTDATNPVNKANELIPFGDSGYSYSELSYNHKALLFNKAKNIIAFPLTTSIYKRQIVNENGQLYESYQYLYRQSYKVFNITLDGFTYGADISHFETDKADYYRYGYEIIRGLYIDDYLYTVSLAKIQVHDLNDFDLVKEVDLNFNEQNYYNYWYGSKDMID